MILAEVSQDGLALGQFLLATKVDRRSSATLSTVLACCRQLLLRTRYGTCLLASFDFTVWMALRQIIGVGRDHLGDLDRPIRSSAATRQVAGGARRRSRRSQAPARRSARPAARPDRARRARLRRPVPGRHQRASTSAAAFVPCRRGRHRRRCRAGSCRGQRLVGGVVLEDFVFVFGNQQLSSSEHPASFLSFDTSSVTSLTLTPALPSRPGSAFHFEARGDVDAVQIGDGLVRHWLLAFTTSAATHSAAC